MSRPIAPQADLLLAWYDRHRRDLPWRTRPGQRPDPYAVWLSEIMLQQTGVETVKAYYARFLARWPNLAALAAAPIEDVMKAWSGLGYYSRARNLHACARRIAEHHKGRFPKEEAAIRALPGIGPYTAAAIAAIAFDRRAVVVDGNVERVVSRLYAIEDPLPAAKSAIRASAERLTPAARPGDFAQAMMDLGSMVCRPKRPSCLVCPFAAVCAAHARGIAERLPAKAAKAERPRRSGAAFFIHRTDGSVLVRTRPEKGLLGGMTEFPGTDWTSNFDVSAAASAAPLAARFKRVPGKVDHVFTHFALQLAVFTVEVGEETAAPPGHRFVPRARLESEALPTLMRKVLKLAETPES